MCGARNHDFKELSAAVSQRVRSDSLTSARCRKTILLGAVVEQLRKKLADACGGENYIEKVWGRGHVLRYPGEEARAA